MQLIQIYQIIMGRIWILVSVLVLTIITTIVVTSILPDKYQASSSLVIDFHTISPFGQLGIPSGLSTTYMSTQIDILKSNSVAQNVIDKLHLAENPSVREKFLARTGGKGNIREWLSGVLLDAIDVELSGDSRVVTINYVSADPKFSAAAANAFADAFIEKNLELSIDPARQNATWFNEQIKKMRASLEEAQTRLTDYQQKNKIVEIDEKLDTETQRLNELSSQLVSAQADTYNVISRQLGKNHPEYKRAIRIEKSIRQSLAEQKTKVLSIKKQRDEMMVLAKDVENRQRTYDAAIQRYYQSSLESQFNQTNIAVLSKAVIPTDKIGPSYIRNISLSVILGLILGVGFTFVYELLDRRVRSELDLTAVLHIPLLSKL